MLHFANYNGKLISADEPIVGAANRGLRYGDGLFETMKVVDSKLRLDEFHFERLFTGLALLKFTLQPYFTPEYLKEQIFALLKKNKLTTARVRLNVFRKNGSLYDSLDNMPDFVIECRRLPENHWQINQKGLVIDVYDECLKACDRFSAIKSNNFLPYVMAALHARERKIDDCLVLNTNGRICDATIANVFWAKGEKIYTPPLTEGCISGVMRRQLLEILPHRGYLVEERMLQIADLDTADELFLTNAVTGIRWVGEFRERHYQNLITQRIYALIG